MDFKLFIKNTVTFSVFVLFLFSCKSEPLIFQNENVEFALSGGWFIKESKTLDNETELLIIQHGRFIPNGVITISIFKDLLNLDNLIRTYQKSLAHQEYMMIDVETTSQSIKDDSFGSYQALSSDYSMNILRTESKGKIYAFHQSGKTFSILFQETEGKTDLFENGIIELKNTLVVK